MGRIGVLSRHRKHNLRLGKTAAAWNRLLKPGFPANVFMISPVQI